MEDEGRKNRHDEDCDVCASPVTYVAHWWGTRESQALSDNVVSV
jgi:hypothetical protein